MIKSYVCLALSLLVGYSSCTVGPEVRFVRMSGESVSDAEARVREPHLASDGKLMAKFFAEGDTYSSNPPEQPDSIDPSQPPRIVTVTEQKFTELNAVILPEECFFHREMGELKIEFYFDSQKVGFGFGHFEPTSIIFSYNLPVNENGDEPENVAYEALKELVPELRDNNEILFMVLLERLSEYANGTSNPGPKVVDFKCERNATHDSQMWMNLGGICFNLAFPRISDEENRSLSALALEIFTRKLERLGLEFVMPDEAKQMKTTSVELNRWMGRDSEKLGKLTEALEDFLLLAHRTDEVKMSEEMIELAGYSFNRDIRSTY